MPGKTITALDASRIITKYKDTLLKTEAIKLGIALGYKKTSLYTLLRRFDSQDDADHVPAPVRRGGARHSKVTDEIKTYLSNCVEARATITLRELRDGLSSDMNVTLSKSTIEKVLNRMCLTYKKVYYHPERRNSEDTKNARIEFCDRFKGISEQARRRIVWMDETGFDLWCLRTKGRSPKGKRCTSVVTNSRMRNLSAIIAIHRGGVEYSLIDKPTVKEDISNFLLSKVAPLHPSFVIMDNAPVHRVDSPPGVNIMKLPVYSSEMNPVEYINNQIKSYVKSRLAQHGPLNHKGPHPNLTVARRAFLKQCIQDGIEAVDLASIFDSVEHVIISVFERVYNREDI